MALSTTYSLDCGKHEILDLDADEDGNYIALLSNGEVWQNVWGNLSRLPLQRTFKAPRIRDLKAGHFVVIDAGADSPRNGYIFNPFGELVRCFDAGDYIEQVLVHADRIVISYQDSGIVSGIKPSSDGVAVFGLDGEQVYGLNAQYSYWMLHCYALCKLGKDSILAYSYTDFPLLEVRLTDFRVLQQPTPRDFEGSHALSPSYGNLIFYASYQDKTSFFWWDRKQKVKRFGHWPATYLWGIGAGKFATFDARSFTIIDSMEMMREEHRS